MTIDYSYEQVEKLNERFGITFNGLSGGPGQLDHYFIFGEMIARSGGAVKGPFRIMGAAIDEAGLIVGVGYTDVGPRGFLGVLAFQIFLGNPPKECRVASFRVFPQPAR